MDILFKIIKLNKKPKPIFDKVSSGINLLLPKSCWKNTLFNVNETIGIETENGQIQLCDYSQAGKNYDEDHCKITIWNDMAK